MIMNKPENLPGRNDPCSCGSGRKFKNCCLGREPDVPAQRSNRMAKVLLIAVPVGILALVLISSQGRRPGSQSGVSPGNATGVTLPAQTGLPQGSGTREASPPTTTPVAWQYDAASNRHWDPNHGHWHDGPPPSRPG